MTDAMQTSSRSAGCYEQSGRDFVLVKELVPTTVKNALPTVIESNRKVAGSPPTASNPGGRHKSKSQLLCQIDVAQYRKLTAGPAVRAIFSCRRDSALTVS